MFSMSSDNLIIFSQKYVEGTSFFSRSGSILSRSLWYEPGYMGYGMI